VAKSLQEARREGAQRTAQSVAECERDGLFDENTDEVLLWVDRRQIRGLPAIGRSSSGVVTDSFVPGSDEHLDQMCR
jgi:hypothetical protein